MALVILSTALGSLFSLVNTDLISLRRAEAVVASQNVLEEAVRRIRLADIGAQRIAVLHDFSDSDGQAEQSDRTHDVVTEQGSTIFAGLPMSLTNENHAQI